MFTHWARSASALLVGGVVLAAAVAEPGPAEAAPAPLWGPVKTIARGGWPDMVVDGAGNVTVIWARESGAILAARRPVRGRWSRPVRIGTGYYPEAAGDRAGNVTVAWTTYRRGFTDGVTAVRRPARGHWGRPHTLCRERRLRVDGGRVDHPGPSDVDLAAASSGAVIASWLWGGSNGRSQVQAAYRPAGHRWLHTRRLTVPKAAYSAKVGIDSAGDVLLGYDSRAGVKVRRRIKGDGWTAPRILRLSGSLSDVAVAPHGGAVVVALDTGAQRVEAVHRPRGGPWGTVRTISGPRAQPSEATAVMDGRGAATVAWSTMSDGIQVARRPKGGGWKSPVQLAPAWSTAGGTATLAAGPRGDVLAAWAAGVFGLRIRGGYRPAGHPWEKARALMPRSKGGFADVAAIRVLANGDAIATFWISGYVKIRGMTVP